MNRKSPLFSVIIPVYNREKVISKCIKSVLNQTFENWELILVDDCSIDNSIQKISEFKDIRIRLLRNNHNRGPAFSRNLGIKESTGLIISFLDSDDEYFPEFLEQTYLKYLASRNTDGFFWTGLKVKYNDQIKIEIWNPKIEVSGYHTFLQNLKIGTNSGLSVKREVFEICGLFDENLKAAEDTEFLLRIVKSFDFLFVEEPLIFIDKSGEDRLSKNYSKIADAYNNFLPRHWEYISRFPNLKRKFSYKMMWLNYHLSNYERARNYFNILRSEFNFSLKVYSVALIFEIFGKKYGSKIHVLLSK